MTPEPSAVTSTSGTSGRPGAPTLAAVAADLLRDAVRVFADRVAPAVPEAVGRPATAVRDELLRDGLAITAGVIESDAALADVEIVEYLAALAERYPEVASYSPVQVRTSGLLRDASAFLRAAPPLYLELLDLDRRLGTGAAPTYFDAAMELAFTVVSIDEVASPFELNAVDGFRSVLVAARPDPATPAPSTAAAAPHDAGSDPPARPLDELLAELDALTGLAAVKQEIRLVTALVQVQKLREQRGLRVTETSRHLLFVGNPGTGKTTVARLVAQIYRTLGVVQRGHLVETDRTGLVAPYVGQTAPKVAAVFDRADEGVLLIDEAYALVRGGENDFGLEAVDAIVKLVEDRRDRVVVIMAGYVDEMRSLIEANPGLASRFPRTIEFPDYTNDELCTIFEQIAGAAGYRADPEAMAAVRSWVDARPRGRGFGNAREIRNLFEAAIAHHAVRVTKLAHPSDDDLVVLLAVDVRGDGPA